ncbi:MAG: NUDIX hydrolase [Actinomycetota bacterium]|nr:NUDIX hydrolase [Actinomycetota bacterium]
MSEPAPEFEPPPPPPRRVIYQGHKIDLALQSIRLADGSLAEREVILHRGAVALTPMVDADHVCLVYNDRYAVGERLLEVPAGTIDAGENPDQTAARELAEETGYRAGKITLLRWWHVSPGVLSERMYLYLCEDLTPGPVSHQLDERLEATIVPWREALAMVHDGRTRDAKTMLAILLCDQLRNGNP